MYDLDTHAKLLHDKDMAAYSVVGAVDAILAMARAYEGNEADYTRETILDTLKGAMQKYTDAYTALEKFHEENKDA